MATVPATTWTAVTLAARLSSKGTTEDNTALFTEATTLVNDIYTTAWRDVPVSTVDETVLRVARALKDAAKTSTGAGQLTATDTTGPRTPSDPYASSYALIRRYVVLGI